MKKTLKIIGGVILGIIVIGAIGSAAGGSKKTSTTTSSSNNEFATQVPTATPVVATQVSAQTIVADFDKNKLAATDQYKGKLIEFTAKVKNISEDITGSPFLALDPHNADQYYFGTTLQCFFKDANELKSLSNGQSVTLRGTNDGMGLGIVEFKDCEVVK